MSLTLEFRVDDHSFRLQPSNAEWEALTVIAEQLPEEARIVFGKDVGRRKVQRVHLQEAVTRLLRAIEEQIDLLPYTYSIECEIVPGFWSRGSGGIGGIRLPGDDSVYLLRSGAGYCWLDKTSMIDGKVLVLL